MPKQYKQSERDLALNRALKFKKLFKDATFDDIMNAVEANPQDKTAFQKACANAKLETVETEWLWNYLKNAKKALWDPVPEAAAGTGW